VSERPHRVLTRFALALFGTDIREATENGAARDLHNPDFFQIALAADRLREKCEVMADL
jgi:hypothetical protein